MSQDRPTFSEVGEETVRQYLRRRQEEYVLCAGSRSIRGSEEAHR